jgi:hypothetical protein
LAKSWSSAKGSPDYFHSCSNDDWPAFGIPQNLVGVQGAFDGEAYAALASYAIFWDDAREFLWQELENPLRRGQGYSLTFRVSLADSMNFAVSNIGALFTSEDTRYWSKDDLLDTVPNVESPEGLLLDDKEGWTEINGQFVAEGGEKYMTMGVFRRDSEIQIVRVSDHPQATYNWEVNSNYIDGVELYEDNSIGIEESPLLSSNVYPNPVSEGWVKLEYSLKAGSDVRVHFTDMSGCRVRDMKLHALHAQQDIDVSMLFSGMYVMSLVVDGRQVLSEQVVVQ